MIYAFCAQQTQQNYNRDKNNQLNQTYILFIFHGFCTLAVFHKNSLIFLRESFIDDIKFIVYLAVIMSQVRSTFSKLTNASAKLSHRRIFPAPYPQAAPSQGNDLHRIAAKIRQLQDDVHAVLSENSQVQKQNLELIGILEELQFVVGQQQGRMDELTECLRRDVQADECVSQYERDLNTVAQQIVTLNDLIRSKNEQFEELRVQKEDEFYQNMRLKEESNHLLYTQNALIQDMDELLQQQQSETHTFKQDIDQKAQQALSNCQELALRVKQLRQSIEQGKRQNNQRAALQRQKWMRLEYEVKLLRERKSDQSKKQNFFKGFYDEERIQAVIDDMLQKQDSLRAQIAQQEQATKQATQEWESELEERRKVAARQRNQKQQQGRLLQMEIDGLQPQLRENLLQLTEITKRLQVVETEGIEMAEFQQNMDSELWQRIKVTEEQNLRLQSHFEQLSIDVQLLQRQLSL